MLEVLGSSHLCGDSDGVPVLSAWPCYGCSEHLNQKMQDLSFCHTVLKIDKLIKI